MRSAGGWAKRLRKRLLDARLRQNLWRLEGPEAHSGLPLRLCYVGHRHNFSYVSSELFVTPPDKAPSKKLWRWQRRMVRRRDCDLLIVEVGEPGDRWFDDADFYVPFWVDGVVELDTFADLCRTRGNIKEDLRRMRKHQLSYTVSRRPEDMQSFYDTMYVPYVTRAHAASAALISRDVFVSRLDHCELVMIHRQGEVVAGGMLLYRDQGPLAWALGVKDADPAYLHMGAGAAVYYHELSYLREQGFKYAALGGSRPFLKDGVLQFKSKWGMQLTAPRPGRFALWCNRECPPVQAFLQHHPFIAEQDGELRGVVFEPRDGRFAESVYYVPAGLASVDRHVLPEGVR